MTDWIYRLASNSTFPDPTEEIAALAATDDQGEAAYLRLGRRPDAPGKGAAPGDVILLCPPSTGRQLTVRAEAVVTAAALETATPESARGLYGEEVGWFLPVGNVRLVAPRPVPLDPVALATFFSGRATVKKLDGAPRGRGSSPRSGTPQADLASTVPRFAAPPVPRPSSDECVVGLDPTAGSWSSNMQDGRKPMSSVTLRWVDGALTCVGVERHKTNADFWSSVRQSGAALVCIDGPCSTNGLFVRDDWSSWDETVIGGKRDSEVALTSEGASLYWTTHATVTRFRGASEWIARSLRLFEEARRAGIQAIETHPHGAFHTLWGGLGVTPPLPNKATTPGRDARLAMLRAYVPTLDADALRSHDDVDAAAAALVAALHVARATRAVGTVGGGGQIILPAAPLQRDEV